jgi:DNA mismatch endonuclease (patch repair protein)
LSEPGRVTVASEQGLLHPDPVSGWVATGQGRHLSGRVSKDTQPELLLRRAVHSLGGRFRLHRRLAPGCTPDFVLPGRRVAVFVDGCFWHGCPQHGRKRPWTGPNAALWEQKFQRTHERDRQASVTAAALGWTVLRLWECQIKTSPENAAGLVLTAKPPT